MAGLSTVIVLFLMSTGAAWGKDKPKLAVNPTGIAVQEGKTVTLTCKHYPEDPAADTNLDWYMPNSDTPISTLVNNQSAINSTHSDILRFSARNGTLQIKNATLNDSGIYKCRHLDMGLEVKAEVKVYIMPDYFTESIVVLSINAVLVVVFLSCSAYHFVQDRRARLKKHRLLKLGHKEHLRQILQ